MEIVSITPEVTFPTAVELPNKNIRWVNGRNKSSPSGNSAPRRQNRMIIPGKMHAEILKESQVRTKENARVLVISGGKRRWMKISEWKG
jgi:hypothetical protein